eukprot:410213-Rhodomonas_salina.1
MCIRDSLYLGSKELGDRGARRVAEGLAQCAALTHLELSASSIGDEGASILARMLGECKAVRSVQIDMGSWTLKRVWRG